MRVTPTVKAAGKILRKAGFTKFDAVHSRELRIYGSQLTGNVFVRIDVNQDGNKGRFSVDWLSDAAEIYPIVKAALHGVEFSI